MYNIYLLKHMNRSTKTETFLCDSKVTPPALPHFLTHFFQFYFNLSQFFQCSISSKGFVAFVLCCDFI